MRLNIGKGVLSVATVLLLVTACRKKDAPLPDNLVQFEAAEQGFAVTENSKTIKLRLSRAVSQTTTVTLSVEETGLVYGANYITTPAVTANTIKADVLSGSSEVSVTVNKVAGAPIYGDEKLKLKIVSSTSPVIIGSTNEFTLSFAEIVANEASVEGNGGGATYGNKVFFDLSAATQTPVERTKWDLGLYMGSDFRVTLNSSTFMLAKQINKTDLNTVTAADTVGFGNTVVFNQTAPPVVSLIDYPDGDLSKTVIQAISATDADNKVYIVNRGFGIGSPAPSRGWKKVRIIRNANGYTVQHADIAATTFTSVNITKDDKYFFKYVSFETGAATIEPEAKKWDLAWTYFANSANFGYEVAYPYQDIFIQNRNVGTVQVLEATKSFDTFAEADLAALTFSTKQNAIGANWRAGGGPTTAPSVYTDRYFVIKDGDNNYYKVKFLGLTKDGVRGYPSFKAVLVKKG